MSVGVPQDLFQWLDALGLQKRLISLNKNIILGFVDGLLVADIVAARFPRLVQLHNYSATSSASGRMANWEILNRKVLSTINCELGDEDIERISNRQIQAGAIITFLRLLRVKLDTYAPIYQAEHQAIAAEQKLKGQQLSMASGARAKVEKQSEKIATSDVSAGIIQSGISKTSTQSTRRPSLAKSLQLLAVDEDKQKLRKQANMMTDEEIDALYKKVSASIKSKADVNAAKVDQMAQRSKDISESMMALRAQNLDDMKKIDRRLGTLLNQLQIIENDPSAAPFIQDTTKGSDDILDENAEAKAFIGVSRRGSVLGMKILDMIPEGAQAKPNKEMEKEIHRRSSMILMNRVGLKAAAASGTGISADVDEEDDVDSGFHNEGGPAEKLKATTGASSLASVFNFGEKDPTVKVKVEASHRRVYDSGADRHFYVDARSGESSWAPPKDGIVNCVDEQTGKTFYTNVKTKKTAWRIEDVVA